MKIAIIQPRTSYHLAGSEKVSLKHSEYLAKLGNTVLLYTTIPLPQKESFLFKDFKLKKIDGVKVKQFEIPTKYPGAYNKPNINNHNLWAAESLMFNKIIYDDLSQEKPDIILTYYLPDNQFKPLGIPNVVYLSGYPSKKVAIYDSYIKSCDATISISNVVKEKWAYVCKDVRFNYLLNTGIDYPPIYSKEIKSKFEKNIVYAGRLIERKGSKILIDAFSKILKKNSDVHFWILGEGPLKSDLEKRIAKYKISQHITMVGLVSNPNDYFRMADICVFPSYEGEGLMGVVLESMAVGKPVISTTNNGNEDIITNYDNGILIPPKNEGVLTKEIDHLLIDQVLREKMGKSAKNYIKKNISWENNIQKLLKIFEEIVATKIK